MLTGRNTDICILDDGDLLRALQTLRSRAVRGTGNAVCQRTRQSDQKGRRMMQHTIKEHMLGSSSGKAVILLSREPYLQRAIGAMTLYYPEPCGVLLSADAELLRAQDRTSCIRRVQELVLTGVFVLKAAEKWYVFGPLLDTSVSCYENEREILLCDSGLEIAKREHLQISESAVSAYLITGLPFEPFQNFSFWDAVRKIGPFDTFVISGGQISRETDPIRSVPAPDTAGVIPELRRILLSSLCGLKERYETFSSDLSGGVDSACIVYLMKQITDRLMLFHAESDESENSDTKWAGYIAEDTQIPLNKLPSVGKSGKRFDVDAAYLYGNVPDAPLLWGDTEGYVSQMLPFLTDGRRHIHLIGIGGDELFTPMESTPWSIVRQGRLSGRALYAMKYGILMRRPFFSCMRDLCDRTSLREELRSTVQNGFDRTGRRNPRELTWSGAAEMPAWLTPDALSAARAKTEQLLDERFPDLDSDRSRFQMLQSLIFQKKVYAQISRTAGDEIDWYAPFLHPELIRTALTLPARTSVSSVRTKPMLYETLKGLVPSEVFTRGVKGDYSGALYDSYRAAAAAYSGTIQDFELAKKGIVDADRLNTELSMPTARFERIDFFMRLCNLERWLRQVRLYLQ